jgi:branched-chain amino acid transport system ATP-binding protein
MWGPGMTTSASTTPLLSLDGISVAYGETVVLRDLSLSVAAGEVLAVLGPNGAGKTTLLNGIVGLASVVKGSVTYDERRLRNMRPERAAGMGIAYVPQGRWLFPYASGTMNLWSGGYPRSDRRGVDQAVRGFLSRWPVAERVSRRNAIVMSGGEQQVVAIGRGLVAEPRLLLIDEPSLGLAPVLVEEVFRVLEEISNGLLAKNGAVILVEQNVNMALEVADHVCVLASGEVVHNGRRGNLSAAEIGDLYLH